MSRTLNFDLFMQEKKKETINVIVLGKTYAVPLQIPAIVPIMMARAEASLSTTENTVMVMRAADAMFGKDNVDEMCANGLSAFDLANLVGKLFQEINGSVDADDGESEELTDENSRKPSDGSAEKK